MAIDETGLTKRQVRKLNALRKSVGDDLAEEVEIKASVKLFRNYDLMALNELSVWAQKK